MDRRTFLRAGTAALLAGSALPAPGSGSGAGKRTDSFVPFGYVRIEGTKDAVVGADGEIVYAAVTDGFATVDVSDPDDPRVLAERRGLLSGHEDGPMELVWDTALDGDRLAVAAPAQATAGVPWGVVLYDVSDPADPVQVAVHETEFPVHNCDLEAGFLYLTGNEMEENSVVVVDVRDEPEEVSRFSPVEYDEKWWDLPPQARVIHDVVVEGEIAYCSFWNAGTWLFDVSDPTEPEKLGIAGGYTAQVHFDMPSSRYTHSGIEPPGNHHYANPDEDGELLAINGESWAADEDSDYGGPSGITLWDVTDISCPEHLSSIEPIYPVDATREGTWTTAHNFELVGDRLYSSWYQDGVRIHDVSDPADPVELAHWRDPENASFWTARLARAGECFVGADHGVPDDGTPRSGHVEGAGIWVFPDAAGEQIAQPELPTREPPPEWSIEPPLEERATCVETPTPSPTPNDSPTPSPTPNDSPTPVASPTPAGIASDEETPGFGLPGALAALGGVTYAAWRRTRE